MDIFAAAGLKKPDISILSDEFLAEVRGLPHRNLAVEVLRKLLTEELRLRKRTHLVQARSFADHAKGTLRTSADALSDLAQVFLGANLQWTPGQVGTLNLQVEVPSAGELQSPRPVLAAIGLATIERRSSARWTVVFGSHGAS